MINRLCRELEEILNCEIEIVDVHQKAPYAETVLPSVRISEFATYDLLVHKALSELEKQFVVAWIQKGLNQNDAEQKESTEYQLLIDENAYKNYHKTMRFPVKLWGIRYKENQEEVLEVIRSAFENMLVVHMNTTEIVVFVTDTELMPLDLLDMMEAEAYTSAQIAVSNTISQSSELYEGYLQLGELMRLGRQLKQNAKVVTYESLVLPLLVQKLKHPLATERINPASILAEVMKHQLKSVGDEELEQTAMSFFECNLNVTETAHKLFIHRNTLIYRLNKLETITGYDIRKFNDAINYYLNYLVDKIQ